MRRKNPRLGKGKAGIQKTEVSSVLSWIAGLQKTVYKFQI